MLDDATGAHGDGGAGDGVDDLGAELDAARGGDGRAIADERLNGALDRRVAVQERDRRCRRRHRRSPARWRSARRWRSRRGCRRWCARRSPPSRWPARCTPRRRCRWWRWRCHRRRRRGPRRRPAGWRSRCPSRWPGCAARRPARWRRRRSRPASPSPCRCVGATVAVAKKALMPIPPPEPPRASELAVAVPFDRMTAAPVTTTVAPAPMNASRLPEIRVVELLPPAATSATLPMTEVAVAVRRTGFGSTWTVRPPTSMVRLPAWTWAPLPMNARLEPSRKASTVSPPIPIAPPVPPDASAVAVWLTRAAIVTAPVTLTCRGLAGEFAPNAGPMRASVVPDDERRRLGSGPAGQPDPDRQHVDPDISGRRRDHRQRAAGDTGVRADRGGRGGAVRGVAPGARSPQRHHRPRRGRRPSSS